MSGAAYGNTRYASQAAGASEPYLNCKSVSCVDEAFHKARRRSEAHRKQKLHMSMESS